jgi:pimeloyl-ACP methyl ester carboxylesterase
VSTSAHPRIFRWREWAAPIRPVQREVLTSQPVADADGRSASSRASELGQHDRHKPPLLFVPGYGHGAWAFAENWLEHCAARGYAAYAMSLRGHGESGSAPRTTLRAYAHDVVQVAARLPRQAVLIGHGVGALAVARAMARYPARAGVLVAPVFGGLGTFAAALLSNPAGTVPAIVGGRLGLRRGQLFGRGLPSNQAREYDKRVGPSVRAPLVQWQLLAPQRTERPVGEAPVLVVGSPDDKVVPRRSLQNVARRYGGAPLLFPGMGHDMMLDPRWREPADAILDWLDKPLG